MLCIWPVCNIPPDMHEQLLLISTWHLTTTQFWTLWVHICSLNFKKWDQAWENTKLEIGKQKKTFVTFYFICEKPQASYKRSFRITLICSLRHFCLTADANTAEYEFYDKYYSQILQPNKRTRL